MSYIKQLKVGSFVANYYEENTGKPKVLVIHGITGNLYNYAALFKLNRNYDIVAFEMPYHGNTFPIDVNKIDEPYDLKKGGQFAVDFIKAIGYKFDLVVGYSMGALAALKVLDANLIDRGLLLAPVHFVQPTEQTVSDIKRWLMSQTSEDILDAAYKLRYKFRHLNRFLLKKLGLTDTTIAEFRRIHFKRGVDMIFEYDHAQWLKNLYVTQAHKIDRIIAGANDPLVTPSAMKEVNDLTRIKVEFLKRCSHDIVYDRTTAINSNIERLISQKQA